MNFSNWNVENCESRHPELENFLDTQSDWSDIPTVNDQQLHSLVDGSLVRFVGMVQDDLKSEHFTSKYKVKNIVTGEIKRRYGRYRDILKCSDTEEIVKEKHGPNDIRSVLFCIPIPGMNKWAKRLTNESNQTKNQESGGTKRCLDQDNEMKVEDDKSKRAKNNIENDTVALVPCNMDKYFPLPEKGGVACIIKYYSRNTIRINAPIEVVGFLSVDPSLEANSQDSDAAEKELHPPPSLVPRIHAVRLRVLNHCNPFLPLEPVGQVVNADGIRSDLHAVFTQILFGDALAADYLIFNLLSSDHERQKSLSFGSTSLNICNIVNMPNYPKMLFEFLQTLLPANAYLPLTIDCLNSSEFVPRKNYDTNRIWSGRLQLANDTHLLVDETVLAAGNLGEVGVKNVDALRSLSERQELFYDFTYFKLQVPTIIPLLILSEGKSMISCDVVVKLLPAEGAMSGIIETFEAAKHFMSGPRLQVVRKYLTRSRFRKCDMDSSRFITSQLRSVMQEFGRLELSDIHRLVVLSKNLAISCGKTVATKSEWDRIVIMERDRLARIS